MGNHRFICDFSGGNIMERNHIEDTVVYGAIVLR